jgi:short chain dehydrogenase
MTDMTFTLEKKVAIVVGTANGIGRATARAFAAAGAAVTCADVEDAGVETTAAEIDRGGAQALPIHLDVTEGASCRAAVAATVERFGGLDVLMYGAADSDRAATVLEMDEAAWDHAGEFSLHHTLILHRSQPNRSLGRRIGLGISYIPTHVRHVSATVKAPAMLMRGVDAFGHFDLEPAPRGDLDDAARAAFARSYEGYRAAYAEQVTTTPST